MIRERLLRNCAFSISRRWEETSPLSSSCELALVRERGDSPSTAVLELVALTEVPSGLTGDGLLKKVHRRAFFTSLSDFPGIRDARFDLLRERLDEDNANAGGATRYGLVKVVTKIADFNTALSLSLSPELDEVSVGKKLIMVSNGRRSDSFSSFSPTLNEDCLREDLEKLNRLIDGRR